MGMCQDRNGICARETADFAVKKLHLAEKKKGTKKCETNLQKQSPLQARIKHEYASIKYNGFCPERPRVSAVALGRWSATTSNTMQPAESDHALVWSPWAGGRRPQ